MLYLFAFFVLLYSWILVDIQGYRKLKSISVIISTLILILIAGLRYRVGGDTLHYVDTYSSMPTFATLFDVDLSEGYGPLWYLFCAISKFIGEDFFYLQLLHAAIINITFVFIFWRKSISPLAALLIYFVIYYFYYNMEILRESLAVCIFCYNINNLVSKKYIRYYFYTMISIGFHYSALILLFFPFLYKIAQSKYANLFFIICSTLALFLFFVIVPLYYNVFLDFIPVVGMKLKSYSTLTLNNFLGILFYLIPFALYSVIYRISKIKDIPAGNVYIMKLFLFFLLLGSINQGLMRITNYLIPFAIVYIVNVGYSVFFKFKNLKLQVLFSLSIFMLLFQKIYYYCDDTDNLSPDSRRYELWYPYESVLNPIRHKDRELIYYNAMYDQQVLRN